MRSQPRVAIVSDPLVQRGGAERVVEAMAAAFPEAPIYALLYSAERGPASLASRIRTSWLQKVPGAAHRHRAFLPFFASAIESFDLSAYDVILSSHHSVAKGVLRGSEQMHVCYCHTPMRALWERSAAELATVSPVARPLAARVLRRLRLWDRAAADRVDLFLANSAVTQKRIARHYRRESVVVPPPIDVERCTPGVGGDIPGPYYLVASRPVAYKRVDLAVEAAIAAGRRVVVAGGDHKNLPDNPLVVKVGSVNDQHLLELMRGAQALLFPQYEDFGMTPLEMNACGRPVIAYGAGGALETVVDGVTGILVREQTVEAFAEGIRRFETIPFAVSTLRAHAERFAQARFIERIQTIVAERWQSHHVDADPALLMS